MLFKLAADINMFHDGKVTFSTSHLYGMGGALVQHKYVGLALACFGADRSQGYTKCTKLGKMAMLMMCALSSAVAQSNLSNGVEFGHL